MSALDRMLNRNGSQTETQQPASLFDGPMGKMLSSIIPREQLEGLGKNIGEYIQWHKDSTDLITRQNMTIISNQELIMQHLGISNDRINNNGGTDNGNPA